MFIMEAEDRKAKPSPRKPRRVWIVILAGLLIVVQLLCDPLSVLVATAGRVVIRIQLAQARQRWENTAIADYDLTVSGYTPLACIVQDESVRVRNGQPENPPAGVSDYCQVPRSVPQAFEVLEDSIDWGGQISARFDRQYGYVRSFSYNCSYGHGLLSPVISDCTGGFHIDSFTPLAGP